MLRMQGDKSLTLVGQFACHEITISRAFHRLSVGWLPASKKNNSR
jgi:hypothetical protein